MDKNGRTVRMRVGSLLERTSIGSRPFLGRVLRSLSGTAGARAGSGPTANDVIALCRALLSERGELSGEMVARCTHVVKIPTRFCVNVGIAAALVMYDRVLTLGRFPARPLTPGGPVEALPGHVHGGPVIRKRKGA